MAKRTEEATDDGVDEALAALRYSLDELESNLAELPADEDTDDGQAASGLRLLYRAGKLKAELDDHLDGEVRRGA